MAFLRYLKIKKAVLLISFFLCFREVNAVRCDCTDDGTTACSVRPCGYARAFLQKSSVDWGDGNTTDLTPTLIAMRQDSESARVRITSDVSHFTAKNPNVASFGFIFFDQAGNQSNVFYFKPSATEINIETPFFFFSGRRLSESKDTDDWDALQKLAPEQKDEELLSKLKKNQDDCKEWLKKREPSQLASAMAQSTLGLFLDHFKMLLTNKALQFPFFTYLKQRSDDTANASGNQGLQFCSKMIRCIEPAAELLKVNRSYSTTSQKVYIPRNLTKKDGEHQHIKYFTHSEQYALFKMGNDNARELNNFLQQVRNRLGGDGYSLAKYTVVVYTSRAMCARCSYSMVVDFEQTFHGCITNAFGCGDTPIQKVFLSGFQEMYASNLHEQPQDPFEDLMVGKTPNSPSPLIPQNTNGTFGYESLNYSNEVNNPLPLIYHCLLSINENLRKAISNEDIAQVKFLLSLGPNLRDEDQNHWTAIHIAAQRHNPELHRMLVQHSRQELNEEWQKCFLERNNFDDTPFHVAAYENNFAFFETLIESGFPMWIIRELRGNGGNTPMHTAAARGHGELMRYLFGMFRTFHSFNISLSTTTGTGHTIAYLAQVNGHVNVVNLINQLQ